MRKFIYLIILPVIFASCSEYNKVLKSTDYEKKFEYAKKYFEEKKYARAYTLLEDVVAIFKGTDKAEESLYLLARSYFLSKDYLTSGQYFTTYYNNYPKGEYTELARYYAGYGYYLDSPDPRLDQTGTYKAIDELQMFLEYFPHSDKAEEVQKMLFELQEKLVEKELLSVRMYYNLGNYMGNNYESAVITAQNAIREYPYSKYREELAMLILRSKYEEARQSVEEKKPERFRDVVDEYYSYKNDYPDGKYNKEADRIFKDANKYIQE